MVSEVNLLLTVLPKHIDLPAPSVKTLYVPTFFLLPPTLMTPLDTRASLSAPKDARTNGR
jgi:hypothetical protein